MHSFKLFAASAVSFAVLLSTSAAPGPVLQEFAARMTFQEDVLGIWQLEEEVGAQTICPKTIEHTTYSGTEEGYLILPHNTIEHNGLRCNSIGNEKRLVVFESDKYDASFNPIDPATSALPPALVQSLKGNGPVINIYSALVKANERFMMGFEEKVRVCNGESTIFRANTTMFFARPFDMEINIKNVTTQLRSGYKYMLIVPTNEATTCVYEFNIDAFPDVADPTDTVEPSPMIPTSPSLSPDASIASMPSVDASPDAGPDASLSPAESSMSPDPASPQDDPDSSPSESPGSDEGDGVCFPGDALVALADGRTVRIDALELGQYVSVGFSKFSRVYGFSHSDPRTLAQFVALSTESGHTIRATPGHFVYVNGLPSMISRANVGDSLTLQNGQLSTIVKKDVQYLEGLYNPQTVDGNIVVDGVLATTFTAAVKPAFANAALLPLRAAQCLVGGDWVSPFTGATARRLLLWLPKGISA